MPVITKLGMPINVEYETSRPPRMPRLVRWLHAFDEKTLIRSCAQRGGPCEYYHLDKDCPSTVYTLHDEHGGGGDEHDTTADEHDAGHDHTPTLTPANATAAAAHNHANSSAAGSSISSKQFGATEHAVEMTATTATDGHSRRIS
eukprot:1839-Heterococcus_DN1.PRE.1